MAAHKHGKKKKKIKESDGRSGRGVEESSQRCTESNAAIAVLIAEYENTAHASDSGDR